MRRSISRRPAVLGAVAVATALLALLLGSSAVAQAARRARADLVAVPVAARALPEGTVVAVDDVRRVAVPAGAVPPGVVDDPVGRTVTIAALPGDPFVDGRLGPAGRGIGALLRPGEVAAPVTPATPLRVAPGERVRITATFDPQRFADDDLVRTVAASALVLSSDVEGRNVVVGLAGDERDQLALAQGTARIDIALLPPGE